MRGLAAGVAGRMLCAALCVAVAGCSFMPIQGPTVREINDAPATNANFRVIKLTPAVLGQLRQVRPPSLVRTFGNDLPAPIRTINRGDVLAVTIWAASDGSSAAPTPGTPPLSTQVGIQATSVPPQMVNARGDITVPFVGQIRVAGRSTVDAQRAIVRRLQGQAVKPQALVTIVNEQSNLVSVIGDVRHPDQYPLGVNGTRVLDAIAHAGGSVAPAFDTIVQLTRHETQRRVRLSQLLADPSENIFLEPGDVLYLLHDPEFVAVLGAIKNNMRVEFNAERLTLAEVISQSGGLLDLQAEPTGVFVFRLAPADLVEALTTGHAPAKPDPTLVPVVFQNDMRDPQGIFLAQAFDMRNKDIVFVANTESVQLGKVFQLMLQAAGIVGILGGRGNSSFSVP
ncbi:MAG TPA: polysaccharide biosynthesis/export family protein [Stellaceae bacterium]|nr:polysaccharide biosynthesis/export family protein [Stellaceae bacterium]